MFTFVLMVQKKWGENVLVPLLESRQMTPNCTIPYSSPLHTPCFKKEKKVSIALERVLDKAVKMINFIKP